MSSPPTAPESLLFPATVSSAARIFSHLFMAVMSVVGLVLLGLSLEQWRQSGIRSGAIPMFIGFVTLAVCLILCVLMAPRGYAVSVDGIEVLRRWPRTIIPAANIASVQGIELRRLSKVCGFSGVYGAWGWFSSDKIAWCRAYVTRRRPLVAVHLRKGCPVILSPDDSEEFIEAVQLIVSPADT